MSHDIKNNSDKRRGRKNSSSSSNGLQELVENEKRTRVFAIGVRKDVEAFIEYIKKEEPNLYRDSIIEKEQPRNSNNNSSSMTTMEVTDSIIPLERVIGEINFKYSTRGVKVFKLMYSCKDIIGDLLLCTHKDPYYDIATVSHQSKTSQASLLSTKSRSSSSNNGNDNNSSFPFSSSRGSTPSLNNNNANANSEELKQLLCEVMKAQNEVHIQSFQQLLKQQNEQNEVYAETIKNLLQQVTSMTIGMNSRNENSNQHSSSFPLLSQCQQPQQQQQQQSKNKQVVVGGREENDYNGSNQKQQHNQDSRTEINDNNSATTIFKRINEMIADKGIFEYIDLRKALQKEGFKDSGILNVFANNRIQIDNLRDIFRQYQQPQQYHPSFIYQQGQGQQRQGQQGYGQQLLPTKEQVMIEIEDNNISTVDTAINNHIQQLTSQPTQQALSVQVEMQQIANNQQQSMQQPQQQPTNKFEQNHYDRLKQGRMIRENNKSPFKDITVSRSPPPINRQQQQPFN